MQPCHVNCSVSHLLDKVSIMSGADIPPQSWQHCLLSTLVAVTYFVGL